MDENEIDSSFLKGIDEIGFGGILKAKKNKDNSTDKKVNLDNIEIASSCKSNNLSNKRNRNILSKSNIDKLFKEFDRDQSNQTQRKTHNNTQLMNNNNADIQSSNMINQMENRVIFYLQNSMNIMIRDFLIVLHEVLHKEDDLSPIVDEFIKNIQENIRNNIVYHKNDDNDSYKCSQLLDSYFSLYKDIINDIKNMPACDYKRKTPLIKEANRRTFAERTLLQKNLKDVLDELVHASCELNISRSNFFAKVNAKEKKIRSYSEEFYELNDKSLRIEQDIKLIESKRNRLEKEQDSYFLKTDDDVDTFLPNVKNIIDALKSEVSLELDKVHIDMIKRLSYQIGEITDQIEDFCHFTKYKSELLKTVYQNAVPPVHHYSSGITVLPTPAIAIEESSITLELSNRKREIDSRLRSIKRRNMKQLESTTLFIDTARRREKNMKKNIINDISTISTL